MSVAAAQDNAAKPHHTAPSDNPIPHNDTMEFSAPRQGTNSAAMHKEDADIDNDTTSDEHDAMSEYSYESSSGEYDMSPVKTETASSTHPSRLRYVFWSMAQVQASLDITAEEVADTLGMADPGAAAVALRYFQWNVPQFWDAVVSSTNNADEPHPWQAASGLCGDEAHKTKTAPHHKSDSQTLSCQICFDDALGPDEVFALVACGHYFCRTCWQAYLSIQTTQSGHQVADLTCPDQACAVAVTPRTVHSSALSLPATVREQYQNFWTHAHINVHPGMCWCPGPACDRVVVAVASGTTTATAAAGVVHHDGSSLPAKEVVCPHCHSQFCLVCGEAHHDLVDCAAHHAWRAKCEHESDTARWMLVHAKPCPRCNTRIDKNGGCNRMHCTQCNLQFCWQCLRDWSVHGYNGSCNVFDMKKAKEQLPGRADSKLELERYLHSFDRYKNHAQGHEFAKKARDQFVMAQDKNEKSDAAFDWEALKMAHDQLVECRRVLQYSYIVAYYMVDRPADLQLFQHFQGRLESFTERLSEVTEKNTREIDRLDLVNLTSSIQMYIKHLVDWKNESME